MDATQHVNSNTHERNLNDPPSEIQRKLHTRERVLTAWRALTKKRAAIIALVGAMLIAGGAYAAKVYVDKE